MKTLINTRLAESIQVKQDFAATAGDDVLRLAAWIQDCFAGGGTLFIFGNGGSAADAQHMAAEFVNRFLINRRPLPALALTTDSSILTAVGNDFSFDLVFAKQIEAFGRPQDLALGISTSGNSANVIMAMEAAKKIGMRRAALTGGTKQPGGKLAAHCELLLNVPAEATPHIQECHLWVEHLLCEIVEEQMFGKIAKVNTVKNTLKKLRIGTRASLLAVTQSTWVKNQIKTLLPQTQVELVTIKTKGDRILDVPLAKLGGKGLFVKEIEDALLSGSVDLAVHSMKDVPTLLPEGLHIGILPCRETPQDAFLSNQWATIAELPPYAVVGTSSLRRRAQLLALRADLQIKNLRGNVDTRLRKLDEGQFDAIILAGAGLRRLGLGDRITNLLPYEDMLPSIGQGALGIELRLADAELLAALQTLHDLDTAVAVATERAFLRRLDGGCQVPIGAHAVVQGQEIELCGLIAEVDGSQRIHGVMRAARDQAGQLGLQLAEKLLAQGGRAILDRIYREQGHPEAS